MKQKLIKKDEVAALLDGEVASTDRVGRLNDLLAGDPALQAEFDDQRLVKSALSELPEYAPPEYLATRVMGEIAARRGLRSRARLRTWLASATGFAACLLVVIVFNQLGIVPETPDRQPTLSADRASSTDRMAGDIYAPQDWSSWEVPDGLRGEGMADFLVFANENYNYNRMQHSGAEITPNLPEAIRVLVDGRPYTYVPESSVRTGEVAEDGEDDEEDTERDSEPIKLELIEGGN